MEKKIETVEKTVTEEKITFVACDGSVFKTEEECNKYEESALCTVKTRLAECLMELPNHRGGNTPGMFFGFDLLFPCCDDNSFYLFTPASEEDIKNMVMLVELEGCGYTKRKTFKENYADRNFIGSDSSVEDLDKYRAHILAEELATGKTYLYMNDGYGWCNFYDLQNYSKVVQKCIDSILEFPSLKK